MRVRGRRTSRLEVSVHRFSSGYRQFTTPTEIVANCGQVMSTQTGIIVINQRGHPPDGATSEAISRGAGGRNWAKTERRCTEDPKRRPSGNPDYVNQICAHGCRQL